MLLTPPVDAEEYKLINAGSPKVLDEKVNHRLEKGWSLYGGTFFIVSPEKKAMFYQPMIRVGEGLEPGDKDAP